MTLAFIQSLEDWYSADVLPFFKSFVATEAKALAPIATQAVARLATEEVAALAAGGKDTGHVLAKVVSDTATQAEAAGIQAGSSSILAAVGNAVAVKTTP